MLVTVELGVGTGAGEETVTSTVEELEVAAVRERNYQDGYHGNELQHGLKMFLLLSIGSLYILSL